MGEQTGEQKSISVSRVIDAEPQQLFDVVADPSMHHVIDGSGTVRGTRAESRKLGSGDHFTTNMRIGIPYLIRNRVVEYEEPRLIAWRHAGGWRWRYEFEPVEGGTKVTETFDWSPASRPAQLYVEKMGWPKRHVDNIDKTLARLDALVTNKSKAV